MKAVFDTKDKSAYDDDITWRYHFPSRYLSVAEQCVGDWIVYREPRADGGSKAYFAAAKVKAVEPDPNKDKHFYAWLSDYFEFDEPVPWTVNKRYWEEELRNLETSQVGVFMRGRSVRALTDKDFDDIMLAGNGFTVKKEIPDFASTQSDETDATRKRRTVQALTNRTIRDARFRGKVVPAYEGRCAFTGMEMRDRKGNSEVQAAHVRSVADDGPDILTNGIALSHTIHWMFDRYLLSLTDDYRLIISSDGIPERYRNLLVGEGQRIFLPKDERDWPSKTFIEFHRGKFQEKNG